MLGSIFFLLSFSYFIDSLCFLFYFLVVNTKFISYSVMVTSAQLFLDILKMFFFFFFPYLFWSHPTLSFRSKRFSSNIGPTPSQSFPQVDSPFSSFPLFSLSPSIDSDYSKRHCFPTNYFGQKFVLCLCFGICGCCYGVFCDFCAEYCAYDFSISLRTFLLFLFFFDLGIL